MENRIQVSGLSFGEQEKNEEVPTV
jgi:hypothetical protein